MAGEVVPMDESPSSHDAVSWRLWARGHELLCDTDRKNAAEHRATLQGIVLGIDKRVSRIEKIQLGVAFAIIAGGAAVLWTLIQVFMKLP